eukprot:scaffold112259_cov59-Phaeocystis_antarctica.AAC.3
MAAGVERARVASSWHRVRVVEQSGRGQSCWTHTHVLSIPLLPPSPGRSDPHTPASRVTSSSSPRRPRTGRSRRLSRSSAARRGSPAPSCRMAPPHPRRQA